MTEDNADLVKSEVKPLTRGERIAAGIGKWVEGQMPPAVGERYKKTLTVAAEKLWGKQPELLEKMRGSIDATAKFFGWAEPVAKVVLGTAALYGGVSILLDPAGAIAVGGAILESGKALGIAAGAAITEGVRAFKSVVTLGASEVYDRVQKIWEKIINPSPSDGPWRDDHRFPSIPKNISPPVPSADPQI